MRNKFLNIPKSKYNTLKKHESLVALDSNFDKNLIKKLEQGFLFHTSGKLEEARCIYEEILNLNPRHFQALKLLGTLSVQLKKYENAVGLFGKALCVFKDEADVYNNLGIALKELKRFDQAAASFAQAIKIKSDYSEAYRPARARRCATSTQPRVLQFPAGRIRR